jgi:hypothetical protein
VIKQNIEIWDLRFLQQWLWSLLFSGKWRYVRCLPTFGETCYLNFQGRRWRKHILPKHWQASSRRHHDTSQKTTVLTILKFMWVFSHKLCKTFVARHLGHRRPVPLKNGLNALWVILIGLKGREGRKTKSPKVADVCLPVQMYVNYYACTL